MVANFGLRSGNVHRANNALQFLESTLHHLGEIIVGFLRANCGFFDEDFLAALEYKRIAYIIAARLTQPVQRALYSAMGWWALVPGLELTRIFHQLLFAGRSNGAVGSTACD